MTDSSLATLKATLIGTWDGSDMILEFNEAGPDALSSGKVTAKANPMALGFDYRLEVPDEKTMLVLTTPTGHTLNYEIVDWADDQLTLKKPGYPDAMPFVRKKI